MFRNLQMKLDASFYFHVLPDLPYRDKNETSAFIKKKKNKQLSKTYCDCHIHT